MSKSTEQNAEPSAEQSTEQSAEVKPVESTGDTDNGGAEKGTEKGVEYWQRWSRTHESAAREATAKLAALEEELETLRATASEYEALKRNMLVSDVLQELNVPTEAAALITGETEEDIRAQATLLAQVAKPAATEVAENATDAEQAGLERLLNGIIPQGGNNQPEARETSSRDVLGLNNIFD